MSITSIGDSNKKNGTIVFVSNFSTNGFVYNEPYLNINL